MMDLCYNLKYLKTKTAQHALSIYLNQHNCNISNNFVKTNLTYHEYVVYLNFPHIVWKMLRYGTCY